MPGLPPCCYCREMVPLRWLYVSVWCGLSAGLLEVATIVVRKHAVDPNHLYGMSRHFLWLIPITNAVVFGFAGLAGCLVCLAWPRRGAWVIARLLGALSLLPIVLVALPRVHALALFLLVLGAAFQLVPIVVQKRTFFQRLVVWSFPALAAIVLALFGSIWLDKRTKLWREASRPMPAPGAANLLLIVMDSVAAGHASVTGYARPTSPTLVELAQRGISFQNAQATSSWTLPSHASMFTGKWPHDLSAGWLTPLDAAHPTLAEFLGRSGYATAGFIANTQYCAFDSGLGRGFTRYEDFIFPKLTALKMAVLVNRLMAAAIWLGDFLDERLDFRTVGTEFKKAVKLINGDRKQAAVVNREFLDWLAEHQPPDRPFFAFLNYFDAHFPYQLPPGRIHRFGASHTADRDRDMIQNWWEIDKRTTEPRDITVAVDAYDDCIADLDEQIGCLLDELHRRRALERTWVIIVSDHGESFGEHPGVFCHGTSLYQTELHVPLIVIPPGGGTAKQVVPDRVSLRDLAATIVDLLGQNQGSPFTGESLARYWREPSGAPLAAAGGSKSALSEVVPADPVYHDLTRQNAVGMAAGSLGRRRLDLHPP